tara:strand:- start:307 stop:1761 length:1455 start_codon:yes stop_codon:yes gene_type:complete
MSWQSHKFGQFTGSYFSQLLFNNYISKDYLTHKNQNNSHFIKNIIYESRRCADGVIGPFTTLISKSVILFSICVSLFFINFIITLCIFSFLILGYLFLFILVKKKLKKINTDLSFFERNKYELGDNSLKGIKEIKISLTQETLKKLFLKSSDNYAYAQSLSQILAQFPRFIFETISIFLVVIFSVSFLFLLKDKEFAEVLPLLSMYAFAGFKIMPSLQLIYFSFATIRSNQNSIDIIYNDLSQEIHTKRNFKIFNNNKIQLNKSIEFKDINFKYSDKDILYNANFNILKNEVVGIFGPSGVGKSTFIDIFTGLINVQKGKVLLDDKETDIFENQNWFKNISYLSQNIFIFDGSLRDNITFNIDKKSGNMEENKKLENVLTTANLNDYLLGGKSLDYQLGYSASKISGGEKQRIGIARALFKDTPILIFDEPTSSLDEKNELLFRNTILKIKNNRFIVIISHNKDTLSICDKIYKMDDKTFKLEK